MANMETRQHCPECGAEWTDGVSCQDHFYQFGYWENEFPSLTLDVHHLMVLCYHLQHPSLYSPDGLGFSKQLLVDFVERSLSTGEVRKQNRVALDSGNRKFKIKGTAASHGHYSHSVRWTMRAGDVVSGGVNDYRENIKAWARSILQALRGSGNLP